MLPSCVPADQGHDPQLGPHPWWTRVLWCGTQSLAVAEHIAHLRCKLANLDCGAAAVSRTGLYCLHDLLNPASPPAYADPLSLLPAWPFKWQSATSSSKASDSSKPADAAADSPSGGPADTTAADAPAPQRGAAQRHTAKSGGSAGKRALRKQATPAAAAVADAPSPAGARRRLQAAQHAADVQQVLDRRQSVAAALADIGEQGSSSTLSGGSRKLLGPAELEVAQAAADAGLPLPTDMAAAAEAFLTDHLRMEDVRRYLLDVLRLYAALQTFEVRIMELGQYQAGHNAYATGCT